MIPFRLSAKPAPKHGFGGLLETLKAGQLITKLFSLTSMNSKPFKGLSAFQQKHFTDWIKAGRSSVEIWDYEHALEKVESFLICLESDEAEFLIEQGWRRVWEVAGDG